MSEDLIKRADAIKAVRSVTGSYVPFLSGINVTLPIECEIALQAVPSADRPQGEWVETSEGTMCSNCHKFPYDDGEYHIANWHSDFCPNCGARMKGADDE